MWGWHARISALLTSISAIVCTRSATRRFSPLPLDVYVADEWVRTNLHIDDKRNIRKRDLYLASIVASGEKTIVYVNSRMETIMLTKRLRELVPHLAWRIGFYNAGLTRAERNRIEELFRNDELSVSIFLISVMWCSTICPFQRSSSTR